MPQRKTRPEASAVNAGSMADIAFLLLIFFLVTTTIFEEEGVLVRLPVWTEDPVESKLNEDKVLTVKINGLNQLLIENEIARLQDIPDRVRQHIMHPDYDPREMIVSLTHDRGTDYITYLSVYDALLSGYQRLRNERAMEQYGLDYAELPRPQQLEIRKAIPLVISEAEATDYLEG